MLRLLGYLFGLAFLGAVAGVGGLFYVFWEYGKDLPEHRELADYDPPTVTRVHAGDGRLLAEFATEKRVFVPIGAIPQHVIDAFLAAEDKNFYTHPGVDIVSIAGAVVVNLQNYGTGRRLVGASTITQQVAKNFLLTNERSLDRKIKEAILALRIEQAFSKDRILELYLNEIYLGFRSYGVAAAALNYFDKTLIELTVAEAAYLAALPKAPNNYHPTEKTAAAIARRNWVIGQMEENGFIAPEDAAAARAAPLTIRPRGSSDVASADFFVEEVRRDLIEEFGEDRVYGGGLSVRTTIDPRLQRIADRALRQGLIDYDRRHGWRGPVARLSDPDWQGALMGVDAPRGIGDWRLAVVLESGPERAQIGFDSGEHGVIPFAELAWARPWLEDQRVGPRPDRASDVVKAGDVVLVSAATEDVEGNAYPIGTYALQQLPDVEGAIVALDPHTGRVYAMAGGYNMARSQFNRATQAKRQPGSAFKPFVYLKALEMGFTPASIVVDAPIVIDQGEGLGKWKPANYSDVFYGPSPLRLGVEKSRNLMTIRLAQAIGMERVVEVSRDFGIDPDLQPLLSMALGAGETDLLSITTAYAMLVNGGKEIRPSLIDRVQNKLGETVWRHDGRACEGCVVEANWTGGLPPHLPDKRPRVTDPITAFQMTSMLEGVVEAGTGRKALRVGKPLAGKTGTTNESRDAWFVGFSPDLAVGVFVGFDEPKPLGPRETGASAALPIWVDFMEAALAERPATPFRMPDGLSLVRIDRETGRRAGPGSTSVVLEAFRPGTAPKPGEAPERVVPVSGEERSDAGTDAAGPSGKEPVAKGLGGLY